MINKNRENGIKTEGGVKTEDGEIIKKCAVCILVISTKIWLIIFLIMN